jgi:hypothetical protein
MTTGNDNNFSSSLLDEIQGRSCHPIFCEHENCPACMHTAHGVFIRAMGRWEALLEEAIVHEMCGSVREGCQEPYGRFQITDQEDALRKLRETAYEQETDTVLEGASAKGYILLHDPHLVRAVADYWVVNSRVADVMARNQSKIENLTNIRHAAAHDSARTKQLLQLAIKYFAPDASENANAEVGEFLLSRRANGELMLAYLLDELSELAASCAPPDE